ncbi:MAG: tetratricopeptide repeat protein [Candidatus Kapabacteria bacterium]|nr:tetratricopeptide repeat protein [Candidatus Kapabacteria bacterium]
MSTRTFEELEEAVVNAISLDDAVTLEQCGAELAEIGTPQALAMGARSLGYAAAYHGNYPEALEHYHSALALYEELGDRSGVAVVVCHIGSVLINSGSYPESLEHFHRALALYEELGNRSGVATVTGGIGAVHMVTNNYPEALEHYHRALAVHEELGQRNAVARITCNLGSINTGTACYPEALEHFHRALAMYEELGHRNGVAIVTGNIGIVYFEIGNYPEALEHFRRSLAAHEELGDRNGIAIATGNIGNGYSETGNYPEALKYYHRALALYEEFGDRSGVANVTGNIVVTYIKAEQFSEAESLLATYDATPIDEPRMAVEREQSRASIYKHHGQYDEAQQTLRTALETAQEHMLLAPQTEILKQLRDIALKQNNLASYVELNDEFSRIIEKINGKDTATKLAMQEAERKMAQERREHEKYLAVLHSTLPKRIADRVARGEIVNDHYDNAVVLFLDVVGFTSHSSDLEASAVVALLQGMFTTFDGICAEHNVMKIKTIGDSYMAVAFGDQPNAYLNNAVSVAVAMKDKVFTWPHKEEQVQYRIGLHAGPVTAGVIGTERMQYDVWGDTVNVASRMESTSEPGKIHISEALALLLPATSSGDSIERPLQVVERGSIDIKGKGTMKTYWLE